MTGEKPNHQQSKNRPPLQSGATNLSQLEESKEVLAPNDTLPSIDTNTQVKVADTAMAFDDIDGGPEGTLDWDLDDVSENVLKALPHTIGDDGIITISKEHYDLRMREIREGTRIEKKPKVTIKEAFKPDAPDTIFWDPETRCRQFTRAQDTQQVILQYPVKSFAEYLNKVKPARIRSDVDRCEWLKKIMVDHAPE